VTKVELTRQTLPRLYYPENFVHELDKLINNGVATHSLLSYKAISRLGDWEHINAFEKEFDNISLRVQSIARRHKVISRAFTNNISDMKSLSRAILILAPITLLTVI